MTNSSITSQFSQIATQIMGHTRTIANETRRQGTVLAALPASLARRTHVEAGTLSSRQQAHYLDIARGTIATLNRIIPEHLISPTRDIDLAALLINQGIPISWGKINRVATVQQNVLTLLRDQALLLGIDKADIPIYQARFDERKAKLHQALWHDGIFADPILPTMTTHIKRNVALYAAGALQSAREAFTIARVSFHATAHELPAREMISPRNLLENMKKGRPLAKEWGETVTRAFQAGQGHLFDHWGELNIRERTDLLEQLREIDFAALRHAMVEVRETLAKIPQETEPVEVPPCDKDQAIVAGERALKEEGVAFVLFAGGDAKRFMAELLNTLEEGNKDYNKDFAEAVFTRHPELQGQDRFGREQFLMRVPGFSKHTFSVTKEGDSIVQTALLRLSDLAREADRTVDVYLIAGCNNRAIVQAALEACQAKLSQHLKVHVVEQGKQPMTEGSTGKLIETKPGEIGFNPTGTGGALLAPLEQGLISPTSNVKRIMALSADDYQAFQGDTIKAWLGAHAHSQQRLAVVTFPSPMQQVSGIQSVKGEFGKVLRNMATGEVLIIEHKEQHPREWEREGAVNAGIYVFDLETYLALSQMHLPWHLSSPKSTPTYQGTIGVPKLELFATDTLMHPHIQGHILLISAEAGTETDPMKNLQQMLALRARLQRT